MTAPFLFDELWRLAGQRREDDVELRAVDPFYRIRFDDGQLFDYTGDAESMRREIARFSPDDADAYDRFFARSRDIFKVGFEELGHVPFARISDMARIAPAMARLESHRTVYGLVSKYVKDERIRQVLSFHPLLVGGNPFSVTSIYALIAFLERKWGVWYAMGGTGALVRGMARLVEELGGTLRLGAEVTEILLDESGKRPRATGVRLAGGEAVAADLVVSNADVAWTYRYLVPARARKRWTDARLDRTRYSMGLFVWYFGTDCRYEDVKHHTILLGPRYKGLLDDIFERKHLADDFSLYLHRPTATDPAMAPEGHDAFYVLSPVPHLGGGQAWTADDTEAYRQKIEAVPRADGFAGPAGAPDRLAHAHAAELPRRLPRLPGGGVLHRAHAHAERLLPPPQRERGHRPPLFFGRRHPSGRRNARRALGGPRARHRGAGRRGVSRRAGLAPPAEGGPAFRNEI